MNLATHNGRRGFAFLAVWGGCVAIEVHLWALTYLLRHDAQALFYLALCHELQLLIGMTALAWFGGRRLIASVSRDGVSIDDGGAQQEADE